VKKGNRGGPNGARGERRRTKIADGEAKEAGTGLAERGGRMGSGGRFDAISGLGERERATAEYPIEFSDQKINRLRGVIAHDGGCEIETGEIDVTFGDEFPARAAGFADHFYFQPVDGRLKLEQSLGFGLKKRRRRVGEHASFAVKDELVENRREGGRIHGIVWGWQTMRRAHERIAGGAGGNAHNL